MNLVAFHAASGEILASRVARADTPAARSKGLLGRNALEDGEGLWLEPCPMIHTFFMKFAIDAVFLDRDLRVVRAIENLKPWRLSPWVFAARSVLELGAGTLRGRVKAGDRLGMRPA